MRHVPTLVRRELASYFLAPMAYLILFAFQVMAWFNFWALVDELARNAQVYAGARDPLNAYISGSPAFWVGLLVAVPALSMRLLSEERRSGTIEQLLTAPVTEAEVVVSKWLAGVIMYLVLLLPFGLYLPFLHAYGKYYFDVGPLIALGIGLVSIGMMFVAIGLFFSSLTRNQVVSAILTFAASFLMIVGGFAAQSFAAQRRSGWADGLQFVSVIHQVGTLATGQLDLRFLALHASACVVVLYLTVKVVEYRREA